MEAINLFSTEQIFYVLNLGTPKVSRVSVIRCSSMIPSIDFCWNYMGRVTYDLVANEYQRQSVAVNGILVGVLALADVDHF